MPACREPFLRDAYEIHTLKEHTEKALQSRFPLTIYLISTEGWLTLRAKGKKIYLRSQKILDLSESPIGN